MVDGGDGLRQGLPPHRRSGFGAVGGQTGNLVRGANDLTVVPDDSITHLTGFHPPQPGPGLGTHEILILPPLGLIVEGCDGGLGVRLLLLQLLQATSLVEVHIEAGSNHEDDEEDHRTKDHRTGSKGQAGVWHGLFLQAVLLLSWLLGTYGASPRVLTTSGTRTPVRSRAGGGRTATSLATTAWGGGST